MLRKNMPKHYITFRDLSLDEYSHIFSRAKKLKAERLRGQYLRPHLGGRPIGLFFAKPSTRTRVSFDCAIRELGGHPVIMNISETQFSRGEPISHSARVLSRYLSALVIRTFLESELRDLARHSTMPIVNALTNEQHPCQVLADLFTFVERLDGRPLEKQQVAFIGDGHNMANTWLEAAAVFGFGLALACPEGYDPDADILRRAMNDNPRVRLLRSPAEAAAGAGAVNTDVFASMDQSAEAEKRLKDFRGFQVTAEIMAKAAPGAIFLHCLPAHPGEEVTEEVLESPASVIFDEAENRLHAQKALLEYLVPPL
ncbi:MAG: ornithine carbamoyltransferase [Deltaproteobacteria bacterium]|jgi:ornithine carbamoyltransferase|nr:ornithine carbamoyltransferase [Deltaproteobacteria bacterium]